MSVPFLLSGLFIVFIAILIGKFKQYNLIAGYNTLSEEKKKKFNIEEFSKLFYITFLIVGILIILLGICSFFTGSYFIYTILFIIVVSTGVIYLIVKGKKIEPVSQSKENTNRKNKSIYYLLAFMLVFVGVMIYFGLQGVSVEIGSNELLINGIYGEKISYSEIKSIETIDELPKIFFRENGFSFYNTYKGYFRLKNKTSTKILASKDVPIYIFLTLKDGKTLYFNLKTKELTEKTYESIKPAL